MTAGIYDGADGADPCGNHAPGCDEHSKGGLLHGGSAVYFYREYDAKGKAELFYRGKNAMGIEQ